MVDGRSKTKNDDKNLSPAALLRANIAQAIKELYTERHKLFYPENKDYERILKMLDVFYNNIDELSEKQPSIAVRTTSGFVYRKFDKNIATGTKDFFRFLTIIPPRGSIIRTAAITASVNGITVPRLSYILKTILEFKFPQYWTEYSGTYMNITAAILKIFNDQSHGEKTGETLNLVEKNNLNLTESKEYEEKIKKWLNLGFLI